MALENMVLGLMKIEDVTLDKKERMVRFDMRLDLEKVSQCAEDMADKFIESVQEKMDCSSVDLEKAKTDFMERVIETVLRKTMSKELEQL